MAKVKDNIAIFKDFLKSADPVSIAYARATLVSNAENILKNKEEVIEQGKKSIVSGELTVHYAEEVVKHLGFEGK